MPAPPTKEQKKGTSKGVPKKTTAMDSSDKTEDSATVKPNDLELQGRELSWYATLPLNEMEAYMNEVDTFDRVKFAKDTTEAFRIVAAELAKSKKTLSRSQKEDTVAKWTQSVQELQNEQETLLKIVQTMHRMFAVAYGRLTVLESLTTDPNAATSENLLLNAQTEVEYGDFSEQATALSDVLVGTKVYGLVKKAFEVITAWRESNVQPLAEKFEAQIQSSRPSINETETKRARQRRKKNRGGKGHSIEDTDKEDYLATQTRKEKEGRYWEHVVKLLVHGTPIPDGPRYELALDPDLMPKVAFISPILTLELSRNTHNAYFCLRHRERDKDSERVDDRHPNVLTKRFSPATGMPLPSERSKAKVELKQETLRKGHLTCGCGIEEACLEFMIFKDARAFTPYAGLRVSMPYPQGLLSPSQRLYVFDFICHMFGIDDVFQLFIFVPPADSMLRSDNAVPQDLEANPMPRFNPWLLPRPTKDENFMKRKSLVTVWRRLATSLNRRLEETEALQARTSQTIDKLREAYIGDF